MPVGSVLIGSILNIEGGSPALPVPFGGHWLSNRPGWLPVPLRLREFGESELSPELLSIDMNTGMREGEMRGKAEVGDGTPSPSGLEDDGC